jgi:ribose transport system permease protein
MSNVQASGEAKASGLGLSPQTKERLGFGLLTVLVFAAFAFYRPGMASIGNLSNILVQTSYLAIFAAAQALVIMTRGFDLSLGTTVSLVSVLSAMAMTMLGLPTGLAIAVGVATAMATGMLIGAFNGVLVSVAGINPFIVTLGTMNILVTLATTVSGGFPVAPLPSDLALLATARPFGVPIVVIIALLLLTGLQLMLTRTLFGRALLLIGSNQRAARLGGVADRFHLTCAYIVCSLLVAIGALMLTARTGSGEPNLGGDLTLQTIAAAVLGGIRLRGGDGDFIAPLLGALFVTILSNGMNLAGFDGYLQQVFLGVVIVGALSMDRLRVSGKAH